MSPRTVLLAPDKFKGSLSASAVAAHLAAGLRRWDPDVVVDELPVADGGEGTVAAALAAGFGPVELVATGPMGDQLSTRYAARDEIAVIEMAAVSGLEMLDPDDRTARGATSRGVGEVLAHALAHGARTVVLGVGGSASTDGGAGLAAALGVRLRGPDGDLPDGGDALRLLRDVDLSGLDPRWADVDVILASDVDNPLRGPDGAAAVYGPQKGADPVAVADLDQGLGRWVQALAAAGVPDAEALADAPGAGAAGGVGYAVLALLGARRRPGIEVVLGLARFDERVRSADLVITGEGSLDLQSLRGKAPVGVASAAGRAGVPTIVVCGRNSLGSAELSGAGLTHAYALTDLEPDPDVCIRQAGPLLERLAGVIGRDQFGPPRPSSVESAQAGRSTSPLETGLPDAPAAVTFDLVVRGARVLTDHGIAALEVGVLDGVVHAIEPLGAHLVGRRVIELEADEVLLPGLVDTHVHINEPGRTEWEGFASATRAAAAGGVTTVVDMPLNSIPATLDVGALEIKRSAARGACFVDVAFWGGAVPGNLPDLRPLHDAGVIGFKCYLIDSGVPEFTHLEPAEFEAALAETSSFDALLLVHAEDPGAIARAPVAHGVGYGEFLRSRPGEAETSAIAEVIAGARRTGARVHIVHLSNADALPMIAAARAEGVRLTVETCPHYLALAAEEIPDGATEYKCCPPIRGHDNQDRLWQGLLDGTIDVVVSDHSPSTLDLKARDSGDFGDAWGGVSSLQLGLSVVWTQARRRGIDLERVVSWMAQRTAALARLAGKGRIGIGLDADLVVFAPEDTYVVDVRRLAHKNPITPYAGQALTGVVRRTLLRGEEIGDVPFGHLIERGEP